MAKTCRQCGLILEDSATRCEQCAALPPPPKPQGRVIIAAILGIGIGAVIIAALSRKPAAGTPEPFRPCLEAATVCELSKPVFAGRKWSPVATTPENLAVFRKLMRAEDVRGMLAMLARGEVLPTSAGDKIRTLDSSPLDLRIEGRMETGSASGRKVYAFAPWVSP